MSDDNAQRSRPPAASDVEIRVATRSDLHAIDALIQESFAVIGREHYTIRQVPKAVSELGRIDTSLLDDGTLHIAMASGNIVGCGGWSGRRNLMSHANGINPGGDMIFAHKDAAVLRLFCVRPDFARQGIATRLFQRCRAEAESNGYLRLEALVSTPARTAAFSCGFCDEAAVQIQFDDGSHIVSYHMSLRL